MSNGVKDNWQHRSATMRCNTCMYFVEKGSSFHDSDTLGRCRRHAPVVQQGWPAVYGDDWCGDHKIDAEKMR